MQQTVGGQPAPTRLLCLQHSVNSRSTLALKQHPPKRRDPHGAAQGASDVAFPLEPAGAAEAVSRHGHPPLAPRHCGPGRRHGTERLQRQGFAHQGRQHGPHSGTRSNTRGRPAPACGLCAAECRRALPDGGAHRAVSRQAGGPDPGRLHLPRPDRRRRNLAGAEPRPAEDGAGQCRQRPELGPVRQIADPVSQRAGADGLQPALDHGPGQGLLQRSVGRDECHTGHAQPRL